MDQWVVRHWEVLSTAAGTVAALFGLRQKRAGSWLRRRIWAEQRAAALEQTVADGAREIARLREENAYLATALERLAAAANLVRSMATPIPPSDPNTDRSPASSPTLPAGSNASRPGARAPSSSSPGGKTTTDEGD